MKKTLFFVLCLSVKLLSGQANPVISNDSCKIIFPTTLNDNSGDILTMYCACEIKTLNFSLYNKAGELKYSTTKIKNPLDLNIYQRTKSDERGFSRYNNGVYYWVAKYDVIIKDKVISQTSNGTITIFHNN